jgi:catechol 2,3-dioxygenase-like lactoylglutathione lyase family enzyme
MAVSAISRIARISLTSADPEAAARFYCDAFGCERIGTEEHSGEAFATLMDLPGARAHVVALRLGEQEIELMGFTPRGRPYPADSHSNDLWFQHFAIVVADICNAYERLAAQSGWTPISVAGPQHLPESSGSVTAFKFRDPEGHPLELLEFPVSVMPEHWRKIHQSGPFLGIDHSAIAVADTGASLEFYRKLGFTIAGGSLNQGDEQAKLDHAPGAVVAVTGLHPRMIPPHLELLCYRNPAGRPALGMQSNDIAKTRLILEAPDLNAIAETLPEAIINVGSLTLREGMTCPAALIRDPDGHDLLLRGAAG